MSSSATAGLGWDASETLTARLPGVQPLALQYGPPTKPTSPEGRVTSCHVQRGWSAGLHIYLPACFVQRSQEWSYIFLKVVKKIYMQ